MKSTDLSSDEIANVLQMWMASRGKKNIGDLLLIDSLCHGTRKMPRAADMVKFNDIALMFVLLASSLKIVYVQLYDAMVLVQPPYVHDTFQGHGRIPTIF